MLTTIKEYPGSEVGDLFDSCSVSPYWRRNRVIVLFAYDAGLTPTEMAQLKRLDVMDNGKWWPTVRITGGRHPRFVPLTDRAFKHMLDHTGNFPGNIEAPLFLPQRDQPPAETRHFQPKSLEFLLLRLFQRAGLWGDGTLTNSRNGRRRFVEKCVEYLPRVNGTARDVLLLTGLKKQRALQSYLGHPVTLPRGPGHTSRQRELVEIIAGEAPLPGLLDPVNFA
jgi:integrase